ncbi:hypothetical protein [Flavobacterium sp.]|uniref:hypothetical protein n=1 Tax=Flavobacterium sp. TaxID=239 RepID=UPI002618760A|nr:hypothetical protein [Flavobacterium sp.]
MINEIATSEQIVAELKIIQSVIDVEMNEDIQEAIDRGNYCSAQLARTGKLLADAKIIRDRKLSSEVVTNLKKVVALPASTANKYVDALCFEENYLVNWCERVNRSCTHQLDWCRTLISKAKAEMTAFSG